MKLGFVPALVALALVMTACSHDPGAAPPAHGTPHLVVFGGTHGDGVELTKPADVDRLSGAPADFTAFIGHQVSHLIAAAKKDHCHAAVGVGVQRLRTDGFALGSVNECGGYVALWAKVRGAWRQIAGAQDLWRCSLLRRYDVPSSVAGHSCYQPGTAKAQPYHHA